jgi:hypothetical protein
MNEFFTIFFKLIVCHLIGDYVLQTDFIAKTKGENLYHLIIHCVLYIVPFIFVGVYTDLLWFIFATNLGIEYVIHYEKAREKHHIDYMFDQVSHYIVLIFVVVYMMA